MLFLISAEGQHVKKDSSEVTKYMALGEYYSYINFPEGHTYDSAKYFLDKGYYLSISLHREDLKNKCLFLLGKYYYQVGSQQDGKTCMEKVISYYQSTGDLVKEAEVWCYLGKVSGENVLSADNNQYYFNKALKLLDKTSLPLKILEVKTNMANAHFRSGRFSLAEEELLQLLTAYHNLNLHSADVYFLLSVVSRYSGNLNNALPYAMQCVKYANPATDSLKIPQWFGELALVYQQLGEPEKSIEWYEKTLAARERQKQSSFFIYRTVGLMLPELVKLNREREALLTVRKMIKKYPPVEGSSRAYTDLYLGFCFNALGDFRMAEKYYVQMIDWFEQHLPLSEESLTAHLEISRFYFQQKNYDKAGFYLRKYHSSDLSTVPVDNIKDVQDMLFRVDSAKGDYLAAIKHFRIYQQLHDSIFTEKKSRQIEELKIQYETAKKDQNIVVKEKDIQLLKKQGLIQLAKIQQAELLRSLIFAGVAVLLIIFALTYNQYRLKKNANSRLEKQNQNMVRLVNEKEWLLKEIHHRVKNNLHMVMGLLDGQTQYLKTDEAILAIQDSQHRVNAMSLIHKKLYQSESMTSTDMQDYIYELTSYLKEAFSTNQNIRFALDIDKITMELSHSVPVGLILNEAVTNVLKYAFAGKKEGLVSVSLKRAGKHFYILKIRDNGIGLPAKFDLHKSGSLGLRLMRGLCEDIGGTFHLDGNQGTEIEISFRYNSAEKQNLNIYLPILDNESVIL